MHIHLHVARIARFTIMSTLMSVYLTCSSVTLAHTNEWVKIESGTLSWLRAIHFANDNVGWIGGSSGALFFTADGGQSWQRSPRPTKDNIRDIFFADPQNGWLLCEGPTNGSVLERTSHILETRDGGQTWHTIPFDGKNRQFIKFVTDQKRIIFVAGEEGSVAFSESAGEFSSIIQLANRGIVSDGAILANRTFFVVGGAGLLLRSSDLGRTWENPVLKDSGRRHRLNAVFFSNSSVGVAVGNVGRIVRTTDGGNSWISVPSNVTEDLYSVIFTDSFNGIAVGSNGVILKTVDSGKTWFRSQSPNQHTLERVAASLKYIFAVGFGGTIIRKHR